jgi:hypothetical protein
VSSACNRFVELADGSQVPNRARMARVDVIHRRQVSGGRPCLAEPSARMGAQGTPTHVDVEPIGLQAVLYVRLVSLSIWDDANINRTKAKYSPWTPVAKARQ